MWLWGAPSRAWTFRSVAERMRLGRQPTSARPLVDRTGFFPMDVDWLAVQSDVDSREKGPMHGHVELVVESRTYLSYLSSR